MGNESNVDFWSDCWCGDFALQVSFPQVYALSTRKNLKIHQCLGSDEWNWSKIVGHNNVSGYGLCPSFSALVESLSIFRPKQRLDSVIWRWSPDKVMSLIKRYRNKIYFDILTSIKIFLCD